MYIVMTLFDTPTYFHHAMTACEYFQLAVYWLGKEERKIQLINPHALSLLPIIPQRKREQFDNRYNRAVLLTQHRSINIIRLQGAGIEECSVQ